MVHHVDRVAIGLISYGVLQIVVMAGVGTACLGMVGMLATAAHADQAMTMGALFYAGVASIAASVGLFVAVPCVIAGMGLHRRRPWARTASLVCAALVLPHVPLGTILGAWTLRVLLHGDVRRELG